jgi:hypothetical protein
MNPRSSSRTFALLAVKVALLLGAPATGATAAGITLLAVEEQPRPAPEPALVAGQPATLRFLLPPGQSLADLAPRFVQLGGAVAAPLALEAELTADPADPRLALLRLTPPPVTRITRLLLWTGQFGPQALTIFPADAAREDHPSLADALRQSRLALLVAGPSEELRQHLRALALPFEDLGERPPRRLERDAILLAAFTPETWQKFAPALADAPADARLLAFVADPALLPGVYPLLPADTAPALGAKITLSLLPLLPADPRARDTFHHLLLNALVPASRP